MTYASFLNLKSKCNFLLANCRDVIKCMELCQIADLIIYVSKENIAGELIDETGKDLMLSLKSFGMIESFFYLQADDLSIEDKNL